MIVTIEGDALLQEIEIMRSALELIWEMNSETEDGDAMQRIALTALERCGYAKPYLTLKDKP